MSQLDPDQDDFALARELKSRKPTRQRRKVQPVERVCATCIHAHHPAQRSWQTVCRRYPPTQSGLDAWPTVRGGDSCGEWKKRAKKGDD